MLLRETGWQLEPIRRACQESVMPLTLSKVVGCLVDQDADQPGRRLAPPLEIAAPQLHDRRRQHILQQVVDVTAGKTATKRHGSQLDVDQIAKFTFGYLIAASDS